MSVTIDLPPDRESLLRQEYGGSGRAAREALLIELYRSGRISIGRLATLLDLETPQARRWLDERGVGPNYSSDDFEQDLDTLDDLFGRRR